MKIMNLILLTILSFVSCNETEGSKDSVAEKNTQRLIIDVEELKPPKNNLPTIDYDVLLKRTLNQVGKENHSLVAHSIHSKPLVDGDMHPFFNGLHMAYAEHRPFVLTPDALWLVICQGFAQHVDHNAEALRHLFVDFDGKQTLRVYSTDIKLDASAKDWENVFPKFTEQIAHYTSDSLINTLTANFTTTSPTSRAVSQLTIMSAMQAYFDYEVYEICGIPQVILEGTAEDWQQIVDRVEWLRRYQLYWWVDEMLPVLKKIVLASQGEVDRDFWRGMYKMHDLHNEMCGEPDVLCDGWIVKFYPYNNINFRDEFWCNEPPELFRNDLQFLYDVASDLPPEITTVPLKYTAINDTIQLQLHAGFIGLSQNTKTHALKPEIGWFITRDGAEK